MEALLYERSQGQAMHLCPLEQHTPSLIHLCLPLLLFLAWSSCKLVWKQLPAILFSAIVERRVNYEQIEREEEVACFLSCFLFYEFLLEFKIVGQYLGLETVDLVHVFAPLIGTLANFCAGVSSAIKEI